jgi:hypothetical protein
MGKILYPTTGNLVELQERFSKRGTIFDPYFCELIFQ